MSVIVTFTVPADDFALGTILEPDPEVRVRLERVVPLDGDVIPYVWASIDTVDELRAALERETDLASFELLGRVHAEVLVRVHWAEHVDGFLSTLAAADATILEGVGEAETWRLKLRFDSQTQLSSFYQQCAERDIRVDLKHLHSPATPGEVQQVNSLTEPQRETLRLAFDRGYFEIPRETSLTALGEELGISDSAVSQRLRRGLAVLLSSTVIGGQFGPRPTGDPSFRN